MAMTWTSTGGLFTRLGRLAALAKRFNDEADTIPASMATVIGAYDDSDVDFIPSLAGAEATLIDLTLTQQISLIREDFRNTIIQMVHAQSPLPALTITAAMPRLAALMTGDSETIEAVSVAATGAITAGSTGTGTILAAKINTDGDSVQWSKAETIRLVCTTDGQTDSSFSGREKFSVTGEAERTYTHRQWPGGSGASRTLQVSSAADDASSTAGKNILTNGDFEAFGTTNQADNWSKVTGTFGADIFEVATPFRGSKALEYRGDGSTTMHMRQQLNSAGGTLGKLKPSTVYAVTCVTRHGGSAPAAGVLKVGVRDSGGTVLDSGAAEVSVTLTGLSASYARSSAFFATPASLGGDTYYLHVENSTALDSGKKCYIDDVQLIEMVAVSDSGIYAAAVPGATDFAIGDEATITVTNDWTEANFIWWLDRFCDVGGLGVHLPSDGSPTIADSLITLA